MPNYYPIMLNVRGRTAIVVGGDRVAAEKAANLSASGANVTVLHPTFCEELHELARQGHITLLPKAYEPDDITGAFVVVVAATSDKQLVEQIWQATLESGQLLNVVDVPAYCNFILPSILRRDQLTIAVSTEGASPSLAKRIRQQLEKLFPPAYGIYLRVAGIVRAHIRQQGLSYEQRDQFFGDFFASPVLNYLIAGEKAEALAETRTLLQHYDIAVPDGTLENEMREVV